MTSQEKCLRAELLWKEQEYDNSFKLYNEAYNAGFIPACSGLAKFYYFGIFGRIDYDKATSILKIGAAKGDAKSQQMLGAIYHDTGDYYEAVKWYSRAAVQGEPVACIVASSGWTGLSPC